MVVKTRKRTKVPVKKVPEIVTASYGTTSLQITAKEMECLEPGTFVIEAVIDFFNLKHASECTDPLTMEVVSTYFYELLKKPRVLADASNVPEHVNEALRRVNYLDVQQLHPRFFSASFVFIPINVSDNHWVTAVVYLRHCPEIRREGVILIFDSLQGEDSYKVHSSICTHLRDYMNCHWCLKHQLGQMNPSRVFTSDTCPMCVAKIPEQRNGFDCGLYVLQSCEIVMNNATEISEKCLLTDEDLGWLSSFFESKMSFDSVSYREELLNEIREC